MEGVNEIKDVITAATTVFKAGKLALEDGRLNLADIPFFVEVPGSIFRAVEGITSVPAEFKDLDETEIAELRAEFGTLVDDENWQRVFVGVVYIANGLYGATQAGKEVVA